MWPSAPLPHTMRYERKFVVNGLPPVAVLAAVRRNPAVFREAYPPRAVNNVYLDTPGLRDYFEHVGGAADRTKTRIRWYGAASGSIERPVLERKVKRGLVSGKHSVALPPLSIDGPVSGGALEALLGAAGLPGLAQAALRLLAPSLVNRYQRRYLVSGDGCVRLTIDTDLRFAAPARASRLPPPLPSLADTLILEMKFAPEHADRAAEITRALPFRVGRCSKYVLGIQSLTLR